MTNPIVTAAAYGLLAGLATGAVAAFIFRPATWGEIVLVGTVTGVLTGAVMAIIILRRR